MEPLTVVLIALAALLLGVGLTSLLRGRSGGLESRLAQVAESQAAIQRATDEALRRQERALEERLTGFGDRVAQRLGETHTQQQSSLAQLGERLAVIDRAQKTIVELSAHVVGLQEILANKQARGAFGEEQLEGLVRDLLPAAYYEFQATLGNRTRVDCLLKLPAPLGPLAIDAKFPREAYDQLRAAGGDVALRAKALTAFGQAVFKHVRDIAEKYIVPGETAEAAFLFVPSEAVYAEIHDALPDIADKARRARVFIVSPTTLWAVLNTVRAVLKDTRLQEQAHIIQAEVQKLLTDVERLDGRAAKLEQHFSQAVEDVRQVRISSTKILSRGQKIEAVELDEDTAVLPERLKPH